MTRYFIRIKELAYKARGPYTVRRAHSRVAGWLIINGLKEVERSGYRTKDAAETAAALMNATHEETNCPHCHTPLGRQLAHPGWCTYGEPQ